MNFEKKKIDSLQALRAIAFFGIFISHCGLIDFGKLGVSVFFIMSGFLMFYNYEDKTLDNSLKQSIKFSLNKIKKLYFLHIVCMLFCIFLTVLILKDYGIFYLCVCIITNIFLFQTLLPANTIYFSLNGVSWYLSASLFIYAFFSKFNNWIKRINCNKRAIRVILIVYLLQILIGYGSKYININYWDFDNFSKWLTYVFPIYRFGDFLIGCCLAYLYMNNNFNINRYSATIFEIITVFLIAITILIYQHQFWILGKEYFRYTVLFVPVASCLVMQFALKKGCISNFMTCKLLVHIGNISSITFILHQVIIKYYEAIFITNKTIEIFVTLLFTLIISETYLFIIRKIKTVKQ